MNRREPDGSSQGGAPPAKTGFDGVGTPTPESSELGIGRLAPRRRSRKRRSVLSTVIETILIVAAAFAIAMLVQTFMFRITGILQNSMLPTVDPGDRVIVNCLTYHFRDPRPGEIVVVRDPQDEKKDIIKRVIALGGDTVEMTDGILHVNGQVVEEPYVQNRDVIKGQPRMIVPEGHIYVMGDNRPLSGDSRDLGPIAEDRIIGRVVCVMWPISHWKTL